MGGDIVGATGTTTSAPSATTATDTGQSWTTNAWAGHVVVIGGVFGVIVSNTGTVLTVDRWYVPATPGGSAGTTPSSGVYQILGGNAPAIFMALTATATAPSATDTSLAGEITTAGGGLIRKICAYAHTTGVASYTLTGVFTANGSDSLPVTVAKIGVFQSISANLMLFETALSASATFNASGDQLTVTETVTN
jgi:hypothetical protein